MELPGLIFESVTMIIYKKLVSICYFVVEKRNQCCCEYDKEFPNGPLELCYRFSGLFRALNAKVCVQTPLLSKFQHNEGMCSSMARPRNGI